MSPKRVHLALALRELRPAPPADDDVDSSEFSGWAVWRGPEIPLWTFLPAAWLPRVLELVDAFNHLRPPPMPPLVHHSLEDLRCEAIPTRLLARRGITICLADALHDPDVVASVDPLVAHPAVSERAAGALLGAACFPQSKSKRGGAVCRSSPRDLTPCGQEARRHPGRRCAAHACSFPNNARRVAVETTQGISLRIADSAFVATSSSSHEPHCHVGPPAR